MIKNIDILNQYIKHHQMIDASVGISLTLFINQGSYITILIEFNPLIKEDE